MYGTAHATSRGRSTTSWARYALALRATHARDLLQRLLLPQGRFHPPPLFAWAKAYPRPARNGPLRRESAAETTSWAPDLETRFCKILCICAKHRRRSTEAVRGPLNSAKGKICGVSAIANLNARFPRQRPLSLP